MPCTRTFSKICTSTSTSSLSRRPVARRCAAARPARPLPTIATLTFRRVDIIVTRWTGLKVVGDGRRREEKTAKPDTRSTS